MTATPARIVFVFRDLGRIRSFQGPLELMARRGHEVHVALEKDRERIPGQLDFIRDLASRFENVTYARTPKRESDPLAALSRDLRLGLDALHFLRPEFDAANPFRERSLRDAPAAIRRLALTPGLRSRSGRAALQGLVARLERALPPSERYVEYLRGKDPDVVAVTPFVWFGAAQTDWIRAARALGVPSVACIFSWDNLTSKGSIREYPDRMTVWNAAQRDEATRLHGVPAARIVATGAQTWDRWFTWRPSRDRAMFCREVGIPEDQPYVLYVESSGYTQGEGPHVRRWVEDVRRLARGPLRTASIVVRPHPQTSADEWRAAGVTGLDGVRVWPEAGTMPLERQSLNDFFDSIHHAHAVVGINTTAFIDSAIVGRPCLAYAPPEYASSQDETVHFHHLRPENGGHLIISNAIEAHVSQLEQALTLKGDGGLRARPFVERFVRPAGIDVEAAPRVVAALEDAAQMPRRRPHGASGTDRVLAAAASLLVRRPVLPARRLAPSS